MYARMSKYRGDPEMVIEPFTGEVPRELQASPGFLGVWTLADRAIGSAVSMTLWESEAAMLDSIEVANRLRGEANRDAGALSDPVVEMYEVLIAPEMAQVSSRQQAGRFARISKYLGDPALIDETFEQGLPGTAKDLPGYMGAWVLADRATGAVINITLWDSEKAMLDSAPLADEVRSEINRSLGAITAPTVEMYEVLAQIESVPERS